MKKMNNKGFSLIELIIVIAIMAVLVAIIAPNLTKYLGKSKKQTDKTNLKEIENQVRNAISNGATEEPEINPQDVDGNDAEYTIEKLASGVIKVNTKTNGDTDFADMIEDVLDKGTVVASKATPNNKFVKVTIKGAASSGYTIEVEHVATS